MVIPHAVQVLCTLHGLEGPYRSSAALSQYPCQGLGLDLFLPCRLSYKGLGEPLCFLAFGPLATSAFFVAQVRQHRGFTKRMLLRVIQSRSV